VEHSKHAPNRLLAALPDDTYAAIRQPRTCDILDVPGLKNAACECYETVRSNYERLLAR
jgi:hypothetical protein